MLRWSSRSPLLLAAPEIDCWPFHGTGELRLAQVTAKASFSADGKPVKPGAKPYVVAGDQLVIGAEVRGQVPAFYPKSATAGCLPAAAVRPVGPLPTPHRTAWLGHWFHDGGACCSASIDLKPRRGEIYASGLATWSGGPMSMNTGEIEDGAVPRGAELRLGPTSRCPIRMILIGKYLIVDDVNDWTCNGVNVTFSGVYTRD